MSKYTISQARTIAISCVTHYDSLLKDREFIIIYRDIETRQISSIEVVFLSDNYQHLTGLQLLDDKGNVIQHCSEYFYKKCISKKLSNSEIGFKPDGTTQLKLEALPAITKFTSITKIIGDSNGNQPYLYVDKLVGGVNLCLGLRVDKDIKKYVPVSALKRNIKDLTKTPSQVLAIFERPYQSEDKYISIKHVAKGLNLNSLTLPVSIKEKISLEKYIPKTH